MRIGDRIREARRRAGISQEGLSDRIKVNRSYLSLVENGKSSPTFDFLEKVADGLELKTEDLVLGQDISQYFREVSDHGFVYEGLARFLEDREQRLLMNPSEEEIEMLQKIRVGIDYQPSKRFFVEALLDLRKSRIEKDSSNDENA
ncbi:helix-turn-helix domain-containing protein [bacterium]|nr:helix-turn-helix domain-containing protein [bacterium]MBU1637448.1 helix-turn-helix domain-containing protein [bacterium]MBU1920559.1 helix-turn-helix domain-containing protein [bacterium]